MGRDILLTQNFPATGKGEAQELIIRFPANKKGRFRVTRLNSTSHFNQLELQEHGQLNLTETKPLEFKLAPYEIRWILLD